MRHAFATYRTYAPEVDLQNPRMSSAIAPSPTRTATTTDDIQDDALVWITGGDSVAIPAAALQGRTSLYRLPSPTPRPWTGRLAGITERDRRAARAFNQAPCIVGTTCDAGELAATLGRSTAPILLTTDRPTALAFSERVGRPVYWLSIDGAGATEPHAVWQAWSAHAPSTHLVLERLDASITDRITCREFRLTPHSPALSHQELVAAIPPFITFVREHAHRGVPRATATRVAPPVRPVPGAWGIIAVSGRILWRRLSARFHAKTVQQWIIGTYLMPVDANGEVGTLTKSPKHIRWFDPGAHRVIADPYLLPTPERTWLLFEEYLIENPRGRLKAVSLDKLGQPTGEEQVVLERPFHLSFPGVFRIPSDADAVYMLPEQRESGRTVLYRSDLPADDGTFSFSEHAVLLDDFAGVDPVLHQHAGHWYLFVSDGRDGHHDNNLHLFVATKLEGPYHEHAASPIHLGLRGSRMAGQIVRSQGHLERRGQNCQPSYGHSLINYRIDQLDPERYAETELEEITADHVGHGATGLHTFNVGVIYGHQAVIALDILRRIKRQPAPKDTVAKDR